jgi:hypothetical protein
MSPIQLIADYIPDIRTLISFRTCNKQYYHETLRLCKRWKIYHETIRHMNHGQKHVSDVTPAHYMIEISNRRVAQIVRRIPDMPLVMQNIPLYVVNIFGGFERFMTYSFAQIEMKERHITSLQATQWHSILPSEVFAPITILSDANEETAWAIVLRYTDYNNTIYLSWFYGDSSYKDCCIYWGGHALTCTSDLLFNFMTNGFIDEDKINSQGRAEKVQYKLI